MSVEKAEASTENRVQWLDEELRQAKAALHKVEHELEQALNQIWNLDSTVRKLQERLAAADEATTAVPAIQEDIREIRTQADRLQERQNAVGARVEELGRQQQADFEKERAERANLVKRGEAAARSVDQFESRIQRLEDFQRRLEEQVAALRLGNETLSRDVEELTSRAARNLDGLLRLEQQMAAAATELDEARKRDVQLEEKLSLQEERIHRAEERVQKFEEQLSLPVQIKEQLDRARFERQQFVERLAKVETAATTLIDQTSEFLQGLARIDQRSQGQATRLMELADDLRHQREVLFDQMKRLVQVMTRQRRRQAEGLTQEIKELSRGEFAPDDK